MASPIRMSAIVLFNQQRVRDRQKREQLTEAFRRADKNGDGRLSVDEIHGIYQNHGIEVTREEVQKIVEAADKDGTGLLTEKEFVNSQAVGNVSLYFILQTRTVWKLRKSVNESEFPQCMYYCNTIFGILREIRRI